MIPRTGRRLQATTCRFLKPTRCSGYSTPSKTVNAAATMTASASVAQDVGIAFSPFGLGSASTGVAQGSAQPVQAPFEERLSNFLANPTPLTVVPQPVQPSPRKVWKEHKEHLTSFDAAAATSANWFTESKTIDMAGIIEACLHNLYDVARAQDVFKRLRAQLASATTASSSSSRDVLRGAPPSVLNVDMYNSFLEAFVGMAEKDEFQREYWIDQVWTLYNIMEQGTEGVVPNAQTYALIMSLWWKLKSRLLRLEEAFSFRRSGSATTPTPAQILTSLSDRKIHIMSVISHPSLDSPEQMAEIAQTLSSEAANLGLKNVLKDLSDALGTVESQEVLARLPGQVDLDDVPEVRPVLKEVKRKDSENDPEALTHITPHSLTGLRSALTKVVALRRVLPSNSSSDLYVRQKHLEASAYEMAEDRMNKEMEKWKENGVAEKIGLAKLSKDTQLKNWMWEWHCLLTERIRDEVMRLNVGLSEPDPSSSKKKRAGRAKPLSKLDISLGPYLNLLKPSVLSILTIMEMIRLQGSGGVVGGMKTTRALIAVGRAVELEWREQGGRKMQGTTAYDVYLASLQKPSTAPEGKLSKTNDLLNSAPSLTTINNDVSKKNEATWTQITRSQVGASLVEMLMDVAKVVRVKQDASKPGEIFSESQPAFFQSYEYIHGTKLGIIKLNPQVMERLATDSLTSAVHPRHLPMLVRPRSWNGVRDGGYLGSSASAMRFKSSIEQELYLREATAAGSCSLAYAGLDILGSTPWRINKGVFDTVLKVWNDGARMGKLPPAEYDVPEPVVQTSDAESELEAMVRKRDHGIKYRQWVQNKANNHSERCSVNYKIEIARTYLNDVFYLPHNLDFRGRAYPIPPHLNHIGDDLSRGLLKFSESKPLGVRGLRWLKIHLAGLCGYDKAMFDERVKWIDERMHHVRDSATKPLDGDRWWTKADDPWQCLAACMELKAAYDLPDPALYESSLPIHQDGTCNGLQHYAALGGDATGAAQVNLAASDRPSDVYTHVALNVERLIETDLKLENEATLNGIDSLSEDKRTRLEFAKMLSGRVSRKVVKQTVMTTVYGVTFVGAREQIEKQLKDLMEKQKLDGDMTIKGEKIWGAASYLAKKVLLSIGETFSGAKAIQVWLNLCARLITKAIPPERLPVVMDASGQPMVQLSKDQVKKEQMTSVIWTTPLGLPIVQPYRKIARKQVKTKVQSIYISDPNAPSEVNSVKQASAFPPNFIHSLDATHMMLTALECHNQGIVFASVHDSYWTHGCDVDRMSTVIRDTFIALHSSDVLKKLDYEFRQRYKGYKIPLDSVANSYTTILKQLSAAGTKIQIPNSQKHLSRFLDPIAEYTDDARPLEGIAFDPKASHEGAKVASANEGDDLLQTLGEGEEGYEESHADDMPAQNDQISTVFDGKFIELTQLIPPLPDKGSFNVENIKESQYFFS